MPVLTSHAVNVGAIAIGHPLGASGARIITTLVNALEQRGGRYGLQTMCKGGGMANVTIIERLSPIDQGPGCGGAFHSPVLRVLGVELCDYRAVMTLILGMSKAEGIYLSADYRLTDARTGKTVDDQSVKFLQMDFPPQENMLRVLMAFTGIARLRDQTPIGDWLRQTLRGGGLKDDFRYAMELLKDRLDRDIAPLKYGFVLNLLGTQGDQRFFGGFTNTLKDGTVEPKFAFALFPVTEPGAFGNGSGADRVIKDGYVDFLKEQAHIRPRKPEDHMNLLASLNRRVAQVDNGVSPHCHVTFLSADPTETAAKSHVFTKPGEPRPPYRIPHIWMGIDFSMFEEGAVAMAKGEPKEKWGMTKEKAVRYLKPRD